MYINNPGHMTKMAAMPIYSKNPSKHYIQCVYKSDPAMTYFMARLSLETMAFTWEKVKTMDFWKLLQPET